MTLALLVLSLFSCHKKAPVTAMEAVVEVEVELLDPRPDVVGPIRWWDRTGLCLEIPAGWSGAGRGKDGTLLTLERGASGVQFGIYESGTEPARADLVRVFEDRGTYRDLPALGHSGVESWTSEVPGGPSLQVWNAEVKGAPIRVEARYPFGRGFTGMTEVDELLRALCVE